MRLNVLMASISISTNKIGSWNVMYAKLLKNKPLLFTHIIAPISDESFLDLNYLSVKSTMIKSHKFSRFFKNYKYLSHFNYLKNILKETKDVVVVNIIDDVNLLIAIHHLLVKNKIRQRVKIIFHLHGYEIYQRNSRIYDFIDTLFVLTKSSYIYQSKIHHSISCKVKQLYNGVDASQFCPVSATKRKDLKITLGLDVSKIYYLWVSQDRRKKGLHIILEAWKQFIKGRLDVELLIIGTDDFEKLDQVMFLGRIKNDQLPSYYQVSTFFLFSTLCHEGHPLSLTEALKSGCYCLVSNIDPMEELMQYGEYGVLVDHPNDPENWLNEMNANYDCWIAQGNPFIIPKSLYNLDDWMNQIEVFINEEFL